MSSPSPAEQALKEGRPHAALKLLQEEVKAKAADAKLRVFLFQLLAVLGQWERALNQLNVASTLDPAALAMAHTYREAVQCEVLRGQVFQGKKAPMVFGQPEQWLALMVEALLLEGQGRPADAAKLRAQAFEEAEPASGTIDGQPFAWIADADSRLGPVLEAVINGRYYWVPFARLTQVVIEAPADLRDVVWMPAHLQFDNGGDTVALIPTRYPGSETSEDEAILMARKTVWNEASPEMFHGAGQRLLTTDNGDISLMDVRQILLGAAAENADRAAE
jgi:type VI secretion system protein ImpE